MMKTVFSFSQSALSSLVLRVASLLLIYLVLHQALSAQAIDRSLPWSVRIAASFMKSNPDTIKYGTEAKSRKWNYEQGVMLEAMRMMWKKTGDEKYFNFIKQNIDLYIEENGSINTYEYESFNLDNIPPGRQLLTLFRRTNNLKYKVAADTLRKQLAHHPRTSENGFWHKKIYPYQMWLDGLYMAEPFYTHYAVMFKEPSALDDVAKQFQLIWKHNRDPKTGLLYHGWDESKQQQWANPKTGQSPNFWGRAIGWYMMALVDVLDHLPGNHRSRGELITQLQTLSQTLLRYRDSKTGLWYQVVDQGNRKGNYLEASSSSMFTYAFIKGASNGYLGAKYKTTAKALFDAMLKEFVTVDDQGMVFLHNTVQVSGLGGNPYRDGSFEYYISEPKRTNDFKGYGPFLMAAIELERVGALK
ncbi:MAG: glycoside hydrolase family 88 protein [bacterium]